MVRSCFGGATLYDFNKIPATALYRGKDGTPLAAFSDFVSENPGATAVGVAMVAAAVVGSAAFGFAAAGSAAVGAAVVGAAFVFSNRNPGHNVCEHVSFHEALGAPVYIQPLMLNVAPAMHVPLSAKKRTDEALKVEVMQRKNSDDLEAMVPVKALIPLVVPLVVPPAPLP